MALENILVGVAGEYLVAGELSLRGYIASITLRNSRGIDIIASNADGSKSVSIQVKTNSSGKARWLLNKKSEEFFSKNHFYIFVALKEIGDRPDFYIVPSKIVAEYARKRYLNWQSKKKRDGKKWKDSSMRAFYDEDDKYLEKWNLIKL
jgi:hypothetical protein